MRGITTFITLIGLFSITLVVAVPVMDGIIPTVLDVGVGSMESQVLSIRATVVKWSVVVFFGTVILWAVFWILRQERQQV